MKNNGGNNTRGTNGTMEADAIGAEFGNGARRSRSDGGPLMRFQSDVVEHGKNRAVESAALEPRNEDIAALEEHARAMAREAFRTKYDPDHNAGDQLHQDRFEAAKNRRRVVAEMVELAEVELHARESERARVPLPGAAPALPILLVFAAVVLLGLTVAPTMRDFLFDSLEDDVLAWMASLGTGLGFGLVLAWVILVGAPPEVGGQTPQPRRVNRGVLGGLVVALALGVWRLSGAQTTGDITMAVALTGIEFGVVLLLDFFAADYRRQRREWSASVDLHTTVAASVVAAEENLRRRTEELAKLDDKIERHIEYVEDRTLRNLGVDELCAVAVAAARDGYNEGIAQNRGRTRGRR